MHDPVNHPAHYTDGQIEVIDFIDDKQLPRQRGQIHFPRRQKRPG